MAEEKDVKRNDTSLKTETWKMIWNNWNKSYLKDKENHSNEKTTSIIKFYAKIFDDVR